MILALVFLVPFSVQSRETYRQLYLVNNNYSKDDAPYDVTGERMNISIETTYVVLVDVEENTQLVSYMTALAYSWRDPRLAYDPNITGTREVIVPTTLIWQPWLNCWNCLEVKKFEKNTDSDDALIEPDGTVQVLFRARLDTICQVDISAFPFDVQFCSINLDGGQASVDRHVLIPIVNSSDQMQIGTPEWEFAYDSYNLTLIGGPSLAVIFKLKRKADFYLCFMILPTLTITSIVLVALLLPLGLNNGEKINMGISGLLGLTFLLSILVAEVPRSKNLPLIGKWLLIEMFFCIFGMVITHPIHKLKKRYLIKRSFSSYGTDIAVFLVVFVANLLTSLLMFCFPNALKESPEKPF